MSSGGGFYGEYCDAAELEWKRVKWKKEMYCKDSVSLAVTLSGLRVSVWELDIMYSWCHFMHRT